MKLGTHLALLALAGVSELTSGCSTAGLSSTSVPAPGARLVQEWVYADFARDVEGKSANVHLSNATTKSTDRAVVLVPLPTISNDALSEMKELSRATDEVSEFVDASNGRYFFCLIRGGHILKTYEFENRASET